MLNSITFIPAGILSALALIAWAFYDTHTTATGFAGIMIFLTPLFFSIWAGIEAGRNLATFALSLAHQVELLHYHILELAARLTTEQRYFAVWVLGGDVDSPETGAPQADPELITLHNGETVSAPAIRRIAEGRRGDQLTPERNIRYDRAAAREAYSKLAQAGAIQKGNETEGPKITDVALFEKIVKLAEG